MLTVAGHRCEVPDAVLFADVAHHHRLQLTVDVDEDHIARFDLAGGKELVIVVHGDEMAARQAHAVASFGFDRVEQRWMKSARS